MPDLNVIAENLAELLTNSVNMTEVFYDLFINPEPMDITLQQYDKNNRLINVVVPNRAKDRRIALSGEIPPEGKVQANVGACYVDIKSKIVYFKLSGSGTVGWVSVLTEESISPLLDKYVLSTRKVNKKSLETDITLNAQDVGALGKETPYGNSLTVLGSTLSLRDQDNNILSSVPIATGGADIDLSNISIIGEERLRNSLNTKITNCILGAPNGVASVSGRVITIKKGLRVLLTDGRDSKGVLKTIDYTVPDDIQYEVSYKTNSQHVFITEFGMDISNDFIVSYSQPSPSPFIMWYNPETNEMRMSNTDGVFGPAEHACEVIPFFACDGDKITSYNSHLPVELINRVSLQDSLREVKESLDAKVNKAGGIMTGNLTIAPPIGDTFLLRKSSHSYTEPTPVDRTGYAFDWVQDKEGQLLASHDVLKNQYGAIIHNMLVHSPQGDVWGDITLWVKPNGEKGVNINGIPLSAWIIESYQNGKSGYNLYSNGYCEQWGRATAVCIKNVKVTLLKPYIGSNYSPFVAPINWTNHDDNVNINTVKDDSFYIYGSEYGAGGNWGSVACSWFTSGFIK